MRSLLILLVLSSTASAKLRDCPLLPRNWPRNQPPTIVVQPPAPYSVQPQPQQQYYYYPQYNCPGTQQQQYYYYYPPAVPVAPQIRIQPNCPDCSQIQMDMNIASNSYRSRVRRSPCTINPILARTAQQHAERMARYGRMSHNLGGSPGSRARANGFPGSVGENIAYGTSTVSSTFSMWRRSSGHYRNMIGSWNVAGFGHAVSNNGRHYWAALYGH